MSKSYLRSVLILFALPCLVACSLLGNQADIGEPGLEEPLESVGAVPGPDQIATTVPVGADEQTEDVEVSQRTNAPDIVGDTGLSLFALPEILSVEELLLKYPELGALLENNDFTNPETIDVAWQHLVKLHETEGLASMQEFVAKTDIGSAFNLGSDYMDFLLEYEVNGVDGATTLARERQLITENNELRILVILATEDVTVLEPVLSELNARMLKQDGNEIELGVPLATLTTASDSSEVVNKLVQLANSEYILAIRTPRKAYTEGSLHQIDGEGDEIANVDAWHSAGITGQGVKVGVIDPGGFYGFLDLAGSELPPKSRITIAPGLREAYLNDSTGRHGTAVAEIIHEMAPDAELFFVYNGGSSPYTLRTAVRWLIEQDVDIINYSAGSIIGPIDGTGFDKEVMESAAENDIFWVNSAGNAALSHILMETTDADGDSWLEFPNGQEWIEITNTAGYGSLGLTWTDSLRAANSDYDMFVFKEDGSEIEDVVSARDPQNGSQGDMPFEVIDYQFKNSETYIIAIRAYDVEGSHMLNLLGYNLDFRYSMPESSISTPGDFPESFTVGATDWRDDSLENYSSQGPTLDGRLKPELSAPTGVSSHSYDFGFAGTSAAAPHVAGAAALVKQLHPSASREDIAAILSADAIDLGVTGNDNAFGAGRLYLDHPTQEQDAVGGEQAVNAPVINIWEENTKHQQIVANNQGMKVSIDFDIENFKNQDGTVVFEIYNADDSAVDSQQADYANSDDKLVAWKSFQPRTNNARYTELTAFLPYSAFEVQIGQHHMYWKASVISNNTGEILASSNKSTFTFTRSGDSNPQVTFSNINTEHDVVVNGETGLLITTNLDVNNLADTDLRIGAYFYFGDARNRPLKDFNERFASSNGNVATSRWVTPHSNSATVKNLELFIPYSELHMASGQYRLKFILVAWDVSTGDAAGDSEWKLFSFTQE